MKTSSTFLHGYKTKVKYMEYKTNRYDDTQVSLRVLRLLVVAAHDVVSQRGARVVCTEQTITVSAGELADRKLIGAERHSRSFCLCSGQRSTGTGARAGEVYCRQARMEWLQDCTITQLSLNSASSSPGHNSGT